MSDNEVLLLAGDITVVTTPEDPTTLLLTSEDTTTLSSPEIQITVIDQPQILLLQGNGGSGPTGPAGPTSDYSVQFTRIAGENLSGHRIVRPLPDGSVIYASSRTSYDTQGPLWLTITSALAGEEVRVTAVGLAEENTWNWIPGEPVFLTTSGSLTQTCPTGYPDAFLVRLATAISPTILFYECAQPIRLDGDFGTYGGYGIGYYGSPSAGGFAGGFCGGYSGDPSMGYSGGYYGPPSPGGYEESYEGGY